MNQPNNYPMFDPTFPQEAEEIRDLMEAYDIGGFDSAEKYDRWPTD